MRVDPGDHPAQANAVAHAPSHYDPLKTEWSQPEVAAGWIEGGHQRTAAEDAMKGDGGWTSVAALAAGSAWGCYPQVPG